MLNSIIFAPTFKVLHRRKVNMGAVLEGLKSYFQNNSREQIEKDWNELEHYDEIGIPVEEYLQTIGPNYDLIDEDLDLTSECTERGYRFIDIDSGQVVEHPTFSADTFNLAS